MSDLKTAQVHFIQGMSRISNFWGFPKAMGAIYGAVYLSAEPLCLDEIVEQVGVSKGAVSTNVRQLERLGIVHKHIEVGERRDYYYAETDFWKMVRGILQQREKSEFDKALRTVDESLEMVAEAPANEEEAETAAFLTERMEAMQSFFKMIDGLVGAVMAFESLVSLSALKNLIDKAAR